MKSIMKLGAGIIVATLFAACTPPTEKICVLVYDGKNSEPIEVCNDVVISWLPLTQPTPTEENDNARSTPSTSVDTSPDTGDGDTTDTGHPDTSGTDDDSSDDTTGDTGDNDGDGGDSSETDGTGSSDDSSDGDNTGGDVNHEEEDDKVKTGCNGRKCEAGSGRGNSEGNEQSDQDGD